MNTLYVFREPIRYGRILKILHPNELIFSMKVPVHHLLKHAQSVVRKVRAAFEKNIVPVWNQFFDIEDFVKAYDANGINNYTATLQWKSDATGWWVQDTDNWYPADSWQKIDGVWYYFKPDGYMATNEYYNGYWFNADGSWDPQYNLSWMSNATGWWVEDISGWWPADAWLKIDGCWYYFDGSGYMVSNCYIDGYWIGADGVCR